MLTLQTSLNLNDARLRKVSGSSSSSSKLASPSNNRSSRRRSTSLSADTRVQDLEAELTMLRQSAGSPALEVDGLKTQLANVRRELNKTINEKIAIETRSRKEVESVKNQLDDANFELDNIRRDLEDGGSVSKKEVEKRQRSWEGEKAELVVRIRHLESVVADSKALISTMKASANDAVRLQAELDQTLLDKASSSTGPENSLQVTRLTEEVSALQQELTRALAQTPTSVSSSSSGDLTIRRLERKLEKAQRDTEALEESLNQAEEENQALRSRVPLPGSPGRKSDDGRQMALEAENENLQVELAGLRAQLAGLQVQMEEARAAHDAALTSEQASTSALRAEHQVSHQEPCFTSSLKVKVIFERMEAIDRFRIAAEEQCQGKVQEIEAKSAELAVLSSSLVTSEARILDLTQQLESAATQPLVAQVKELEISVESLAKERHIAVGTESRLNTEIASLQRELADCHDDLKTERAEMSIIQIQLDELSEQNTVLRAEVDDLEDRLELTIHEKQGIEELLSAAQDDQADRSTESEADARNMELVKLKSDLSDASQALEAKEQEMQKELELVSFVKDKIAQEAQERIATLKQEVLAAQSAYAEKESALQAMVDKLKSDLEASRIEITDLESSISALKADLNSASTHTAPGTGHLGLLYTKISSLRSERDDLRQALSFAQNESRFTIRAAQADRESAIEELEKVKRDLNNQLAIHESLETEVSSVRTQLNEKEAKLEDVKSLYAGAAFEKGDVADQIDQYEREVASAKLERDHLVKELGESHKQIMELNHAMAMMRTGTETDMRHRKISMERKIAIAEMPKITETSTGVAVDRGPLNSSRRPGHSRTKSEIANLVLPDQAHMAFLTAKLAEVEADLKVVSGKLERRNGQCSCGS
jgi:chromosome segregation ATPase